MMRRDRTRLQIASYRRKSPFPSAGFRGDDEKHVDGHDSIIVPVRDAARFRGCASGVEAMTAGPNGKGLDWNLRATHCGTSDVRKCVCATSTDHGFYPKNTLLRSVIDSCCCLEFCRDAPRWTSCLESSALGGSCWRCWKLIFLGGDGVKRGEWTSFVFRAP